ncbi:MAG: hypothetical protein ACI841_004370 [Planctomycetota bacterium]|jgi:hypothetical protein
MAQTTLRSAFLVAAGLCVTASAAQAQWQDNTADIPSGNPFNNSSSENVDFADIDLDGDWDAAFGDGGDGGNDQNRLWVNQGNAQGGTTGVFLDRTSTQFPSVSDQSRDIEFVDFDADGDPDLYISNTSQITNQSNRWWVNNGGAQGGTAGFYTDETSSRWIGLGGAGSSIANSAIIGSGGFIDWSCDCDFGDLDNDGDLDLVHSSYGGAFGGNVPTRIFLNDGNGFFSEFNPSGFQLGGDQINNGNPGLWCDGNQSANTTNSTGVSCDIASSALDIDLGDIDGDFDLDILHGARQEAPRMFANRLEGSSIAPSNGGALGFRDVTGSVFPSGYSSGDGHYEQEMADLDGDGDLDIYGLNWLAGFGFDDCTMRNNGSGTFNNLTTLAGSGADDNEGDFLDYDNDGDLDLFVCNFSGSDKLYRNNNNGGSSFSFTQVSGLPGATAIGLDADCCDVDNDGDYDIIVANDNNVRNFYFKNLNNTADTTAPYIPNVEQAPDRACGAAPTVVRAHVYDNAPYYITWYNPTHVSVTVDGGSATIYPAVSSAGQIFRAEIPGELSGTIAYTFHSEDEYGNAGSSATLSYDATGNCGGGGPTAYCVPTSSNSVSAGGAVLASTGNYGTASATFLISDIPDQPGLLYAGPNMPDLPFGCGRRCVGGSTIRGSVIFPSGNQASTGFDMSPANAINIQWWYRDPAHTTTCGNSYSLSNALMP